MRLPSRHPIPFIMAVAVSFAVAGCSSDSRAGEDQAAESAPQSISDAPTAEGSGGDEPATETGTTGAREEHARSEGGGEHSEGGMSREDGEHAESDEHAEGGEGDEEEPGVYVSTRETWYTVRRGVRLVLMFLPDRGVFFGTVENTTEATLCAVRVEVHLDSGMELGPTEPPNLEAGQKMEVALPTGGEAFETWTAHPELSSCAG